MSRKRNTPIDLLSVKIDDMAAEGKSIARPEGWPVVFLPFGAPGDIVDCRITKKKKSFAEGFITRIVEPSPIRVVPKCSHFTVCGGCKWQHVPYTEQLKFKQQQVVDALTRIGHLSFPEIRHIIGADEIWHYRNKLEYTFSAKRWLTFEQMEAAEVETIERRGAGFHIPGSFDKVLDIDCCYLQEDFSNQVRLFIKKWGIEHNLSFYDARAQEGYLRNMIVRTASTGQKMVILVVGSDDSALLIPLLDAVKSQFPEITSLQYIINEKVNDSVADLPVCLYAGMPYIEEFMGDLTFRISPKSFYQTNSSQAHKLYHVALDFAQLTGEERVYDLYTGTGTIANFIARHCKSVVGIEYVEDAIADAKINSTVNGISNTDFYAGDMKDVLTDDFIAGHGGTPDVMIIDPPRAGMHQSVVDTILRAEPRRIVYVSCNPATQARDLSILSQSYDIAAVQPVDMFPHTHHVENVVLLNRKC